MERFFTNHYKDIVKMTEKITQHRDYEEIAHYVMEQFMIHPRRDELIKKGEAMKFMSGMIWRNFHSSTSPYHKLYRQNSKIFPYDPFLFNDSNLSKDDIDTDHDQSKFQNYSDKKKLRVRLQDEAFEDTDYDWEKDLKIDAINGILEDMEGEGLHLWYISTLFKMWVKQPNYSELSRQTRIPRTSISEAIDEAREHIIQKLKDNGIID
jgi:hypothetical protein